MPLRGVKTARWTPLGVSDAADSTNAFIGAMSALSNLVPDPSTKGVFVPRPASVQLPGVAVSAGPISVFLILGDTVYGMIGNSHTGFDTPFVYNLDTQTLSTPSGVTASNVPLSQPTFGDWTPPTMATLSTYIIVTHPGFTGPANGFIGYFNISNPSAPTWNSGNLTINVLPTPPSAVAVFGGRAYYAVGNAVQASDVLFPLQQTNANQVLTLGDSTPITALKGLPLNNTTGGIVQALMCFKGVSNIYQIAGDYLGYLPGATVAPWSLNSLNIATGTQAPNTVCSTPYGLAFMAPDGLRVIDFNANVSDPIGEHGAGIVVPFQTAVSPSRMVAAFNAQTMRIAVRVTEGEAEQVLQNQQTDSAVITPILEYWYNFSLQAWTGPHPIPTTFIQPWQDTFIASMLPVGG